VLLTPLTTDKDALAEMLPALDDTLLSERGSRLELGLQAALGAFKAPSARPRIVLLLSDGENPHRGERAAARPLLDARVRVVAAAFGSDEGTTLPDQGGFVTDAQGRVVVSRRDAQSLAALAEATDGAVFVADRWGELDRGALVAAVRRDADQTGTGFVERRVPRSRAAAFAALALALLLAEAGGLRIAAARLRRVPALAALALLATGAGPLRDAEEQVRARPGDPLALVSLGLARAEAGDTQEAERAFTAAALVARDPAAAALAYYDLGVSALGRGDLERARDAFLDAVALAPGDDEARFNLEWTLDELAEPPLRMTPPETGADRERPGEAPGADSRDGADEAPGDRTDRETAGQEGGAERGEESGEQGEARSAAQGRSGQAGGGRGARSAVKLAPEEAARWLDGVRDDPGRALASAARADAPRTPRRPDAPTW
jgi:tetratricopeptide (TPR) repeat protein